MKIRRIIFRKSKLLYDENKLHLTFSPTNNVNCVVVNDVIPK